MKNAISHLLAIAAIALLTTTGVQAQKAVQISLISPLGTNGNHSQETINNVSINFLGGYSKANNIFEFGGLYNINMEYTRGFQFGGLTNISAHGDRSFQFAGLANVNANQNKGQQIAGLFNVASDGHVGFQFGGILNYAKSAGTQVGLINIADEVSGVPIGLINIVKKDGKQEFELGFSDALNSYLSFKLGTNKFYTIFSGGVNFYDINKTEMKEPVEYAAGLGFGSSIVMKNNFSTQFEVMGYGLTENQKFSGDLNLLTQFKITTTKELNSGVKLFAGPTFNMTISQATNSAGVLQGPELAPYKMYEHQTESTDLKAWVGFTFGLRY